MQGVFLLLPFIIHDSALPFPSIIRPTRFHPLSPPLCDFAELPPFPLRNLNVIHIFLSFLSIFSSAKVTSGLSSFSPTLPPFHIFILMLPFLFVISSFPSFSYSSYVSAASFVFVFSLISLRFNLIQQVYNFSLCPVSGPFSFLSHKYIGFLHLLQVY